mgnify:CR=1 FL=1
MRVNHLRFTRGMRKMAEKNEVRLAYVESNFADIIWENEPIGSGELVKLCDEKLNWKKRLKNKFRQ